MIKKRKIIVRFEDESDSAYFSIEIHGKRKEIPTLLNMETALFEKMKKEADNISTCWPGYYRRTCYD